MYKNSFNLLILVLLTNLSLSAFGLQPFPAKGLYEIGQIPANDLHRYFCQTYAGEEGIVLNDPWKGEPWRHSSCRNMVDKMKSRLQLLATGETSNVIDAEFIKEIAHLSRVPDEGNNGYRADNVFYDVNFASKESLLEFNRIAKEIFKMSNSELYIRAEEIDYKKQSTLTARSLNAQNFSEGIYSIYGIDSHSINGFVEKLIININSMMTNIREDEKHDDIEIRIIYLSRLFLSAHPFPDGNTRTTLILLNFMRLYLGQPPYEAYSIPDLRHNSALFIHSVLKEK
ncbi:Fic family protein [Parendozoicomonas sp. Alg238-R29]|uniref:Fic family protein n=1 Tax=Parendozoicomonas sp. Alg238-R29 TaxID=2993446 RepID=UPI00248D828A|nr:Fic family protein [Parendozoicomonas sp. Alg238-R29]